jgi:hypothetical protein
VVYSNLDDFEFCQSIKYDVTQAKDLIVHLVVIDTLADISTQISVFDSEAVRSPDVAPPENTNSPARAAAPPFVIKRISGATCDFISHLNSSIIRDTAITSR